MMVTALIIAFLQSWKLTLIIIAVALPLFVVLGVTMTMEANVESKLLKIYAEKANLAEETIGSIKTVHAFEATRPLLNKFDDWLVKASEMGRKKGPTLGVMYASEFFSFVPHVLAFWQGARMYVAGEIDSVGTLIM